MIIPINRQQHLYELILPSYKISNKLLNNRLIIKKSSHPHTKMGKKLTSDRISNRVPGERESSERVRERGQ